MGGSTGPGLNGSFRLEPNPRAPGSTCTAVPPVLALERLSTEQSPLTRYCMPEGVALKPSHSVSSGNKSARRMRRPRMYVPPAHPTCSATEESGPARTWVRGRGMSVGCLIDGKWSLASRGGEAGVGGESRGRVDGSTKPLDPKRQPSFGVMHTPVCTRKWRVLTSSSPMRMAQSEPRPTSTTPSFKLTGFTCTRQGATQEESRVQGGAVGVTKPGEGVRCLQDAGRGACITPKPRPRQLKPTWHQGWRVADGTLRLPRRVAGQRRAPGR